MTETRLDVRCLRVSRGSVRNLCYVALASDTREAVLIDPAWEFDAIERALQDLGVTVVGILITHAHSDHINLADACAERHGVPVYMAREEAAYYGYSSRFLDAFDSSSIRVGGLRVTAIPTPGHTHGSRCFLIGDALFSGDTLFTEGCGICTSPGGSAGAMFESLRLLKQEVPANARVFPGHSFGRPPGRTFQELKRLNVYLGIDDKDQFVQFRMRPNQKAYRFQ